MSPPAGRRGAGVHREEVQEEQCSGGPALQHAERSGGHPQELQPAADPPQLPGELCACWDELKTCVAIDILSVDRASTAAAYWR